MHDFSPTKIPEEPRNSIEKYPEDHIPISEWNMLLIVCFKKSDSEKSDARERRKSLCTSK